MKVTKNRAKCDECHKVLQRISEVHADDTVMANKMNTNLDRKKMLANHTARIQNDLQRLGFSEGE